MRICKLFEMQRQYYLCIIYVILCSRKFAQWLLERTIATPVKTKYYWVFTCEYIGVLEALMISLILLLFFFLLFFFGSIPLTSHVWKLFWGTKVCHFCGVGWLMEEERKQSYKNRWGLMQNKDQFVICRKQLWVTHHGYHCLQDHCQYQCYHLHHYEASRCHYF